jgi:hypothetical protein
VCEELACVRQGLSIAAIRRFNSTATSSLKSSSPLIEPVGMTTESSVSSNSAGPVRA